MKVIGNSRPRKGRDPFELFEVKNRKNAGNNRRLNADLPRPGGKIKIVGVIEEQLRDDNVGSGRRKPVRRFDKLCPPLWRITAKGHNEIQAFSFKMFYIRPDGRSVGPHTGKVKGGGQPQFAVNADGQIAGKIARRTACAIGDRNEGRLELGQIFEGLKKSGHSRIVLGRKGFEGKGDFSGSIKVAKIHQKEATVMNRFRIVKLCYRYQA